MFNLPFSEWLVNQHRDSFASYIGHPNLVEFFAIAENESKARVKFNFLQVCMAPALCCLQYGKPNPIKLATVYLISHTPKLVLILIRKCSMYLCPYNV